MLFDNRLKLNLSAQYCVIVINGRVQLYGFDLYLEIKDAWTSF